ncbi:hypothetical protein [Aquimarina sediminis]|uniref:hypothetical protein n=1 Tax=Aquimarina sediminis TaxID=2070536 RepID=UPI000CA0400B|nr:hypothetical protein [Aquimarina sediminis]
MKTNDFTLLKALTNSTRKQEGDCISKRDNGTAFLLNSNLSLKKKGIICLILVIGVFLQSTFGQSPLIKKEKYTNISNPFITDYSTRDYEAAIIGFRALNGDIQEKGTGNIIQVYMFKIVDKWAIKADFRSHGDHEIWEVDVMFVSKGLFDETGNVGIGTTTPSEKLEIKGTNAVVKIDGRGDAINSREGKLKISGARDADGNSFGAIQFYNYDNRGSKTDFNAGGMRAIKDTPNGSRLAFLTAFDGIATEHMTINTSGSIGIGTSSPGAKLDVVGIGHFSESIGIGTKTPTERMEIKGTNAALKIDGRNDTNVDGIGTLKIAGARNIDGNSFGEIQFYNFENQGSATEFYAGGIQAIKNTDSGSRLSFVTAKTGIATERMTIDAMGNVGVGTARPSEKLQVEGTVKATSFISSAASFPDYVFKKGYTIMSLSELSEYISKNHHLPNMPTEKEVVKNGLEIPNVVIKSVENIEIIYLHLIQLKKELQELKKENSELQQRLKVKK